MKDRIPTYPGRVRMTPVPGQENVYDMERADEPRQAGTPLNKETLLTDESAQEFGGDENWSIEDIWKSYRLHRWAKHSVDYTEIETQSPYATDKTYGGTNCYYFGYYANSTQSGTASVIQYSEAIDVDSNGKMTLVNPSEITMPITTDARYIINVLTTLANKYFKFKVKGTRLSSKFTTSDVYKWKGSGSSYTYSDGYWLMYETYFYLVTQRTQLSYIEDVDSESGTEYPINGIKDGYYYSYTGRRIDTVKEGVKVKTGSYVGTGLSSSAVAPHEWDFEGEPLLLIIKKYGSEYSHMMPFIGLGTTAFRNYAWMYSWSGIYFSYQSASYARLIGKNHLERYGDHMMNESGATYYYMLFYR